MSNSRWDLDGWKKSSQGGRLYYKDPVPVQPLDYEAKPGDSCPCCHKHTWLDRLWSRLRRD